MGILDSGLLGPFRNKVGPIVGRKHRGQDVVSKNYTMSTKAPTPAQQQERDKFSLLTTFISKITSLVDPGFKAYAKTKSALNAAYAYNVKDAFIMVEDNPELNYPKIIYSRGRIALPYGLQVSVVNEMIHFSWHAQAQTQFCQFTDKASFLVVSAIENARVISKNAVERHKLEFDLVVPPRLSGKLVHCYLNFSSADGKLAGDSQYIGELVL